MNSRLVKSVISVFALFMIGIHFYLPNFKIDTGYIALIIIAIFPWLAPLFRSVEVPGFFKIELNDVESFFQKAKDVGLLSKEDSIASMRASDNNETIDQVDERKDRKVSIGTEKELDRHIYAFEQVAGSDKKLILAGFRIEIESLLRAIAIEKGIDEKEEPIKSITRKLVSENIFSEGQLNVIEKLRKLIDKATHGAQIDEDAYNLILRLGPKILDFLRDISGEKELNNLLIRWKARDGAAGAEIGTKLSKAFVGSPKTFLKTMKKDKESFNEWIEGLQYHTFTIYESQNEVEDDLYIAYYEKLKQLMRQTANKLLSTDLKSEASRLLDALEQIEIRRIW